MFATLLLAAVPVFAQLSLAQAQQRVSGNDAGVQSALADVRRRDADLALARITGVPHLNADYSLAPQAGPNDTGTVEQHFITVGAGITIGDLLGAPSAVRAAADDVLVAQRHADAAVLAARENAAKLYFDALQAIAVEKVRADSLRGAQRDRDAAEIRVRAGDSPQLDVVRADVTLAQARADLSRAQADRADAVDALASATAVDPATLAALAPGDVSGITLPAVDTGIGRALAARPELAELLATIASRSAGVATARRASLPTATLEGGYQRGVDTAIPVAGPQVAAHLDLPIAGGGSARVAAAQADVDAAQAQLAAEQRAIRLEVGSAIRDAQADDAAQRGAHAARDEAARALDAVELGYREGASSSLEVAEAHQTFVQASVDALVADYRVALAYAVLEIVIP